MEAYLSSLNPEQLQAVEHASGPLLIIAGAGSGKTKTLTARVANLIAKGEDPYRLLVLTFTNKAANEMKQRVQQYLQRDMGGMFMGTFHGIFLRFLREEAGLLGYPRNFSILDEDAVMSKIKGIIKRMDLDPAKGGAYDPRTIRGVISRLKNRKITAEDYAQNVQARERDKSAMRGEFAKIYQYYSEICVENKVMDFDDLLLKFYVLLQRFPERLFYYQQRFTHILIDEYQDTNNLQYEIIRLLVARHRNLCVVGDDAQSIYRFRGAEVENILNFERDYPEAKIVKLEQNYRSSKRILQAANAVIKKNEEQIEKSLWTENSEGTKVVEISMATDTQEGQWVADTIREYMLRYHYKNQDFAVLYRSHYMSRGVEEALRKANISYKVYGGIGFYERKEIKDLLAYLDVIMNPYNDESLLRIINYPARGIGKVTLEKYVTLAYDNRLPIWVVLQQGAGDKAVQNFLQLMNYLSSLLARYSLAEFVNLVLDKSGLKLAIKQDDDYEERQGNIDSLLNGIEDFENEQEEAGAEITAEKLLPTYLQNVALMTDGDEENNSKVSLMSVHAAKGLEFPCVFVIGMSLGDFPSSRSFHDKRDLEEERRLFYVAVSRAKENLFLSYSRSRYVHREVIFKNPSPFLSEIPQDFKQVLSQDTQEEQTDYGRGGWRKFQHGAKVSARDANSGNRAMAQSRLKKLQPNMQFALGKVQVRQDLEQFRVNSRVVHKTFGSGVIVALEGEAGDPVARILFDTKGEKRILLKYASQLKLQS